jgi:hypothetical protein
MNRTGRSPFAKAFVRRRLPALSLLLVAALCASLALLAPAVRAASTWHVSPGNAGACTVADPNCATIQAAVTAASAGDTIQVAAGTYAEHITIGKDLTINGAGAAQTIVDGTQSGTVFTINSGTVSLSGITITNGKSPFMGGGIFNSGTLTVTNVIVSNNSSAFAGGGIANVNNSMLTATNSTVSNNSAGTAGGGIVNINNLNNNIIGTLTVTNSTVSNNSAFTGGGGISNDGLLVVTNSTVSNNSTAAGGGGIDNNDGDNTNGGRASITGSTVSNNSVNNSVPNVRAGSPAQGGGIVNNHGTLTVTSSTISGNSVVHSNNSTGNGGGIANISNSVLTVTSSTVSNNSASDNGGGILNSASTASVRSSIVAGNTSTSDPDVSGQFTSQGHNLVGASDGTNGFANGVNGDIVGTIASPVDPQLLPLGNYGGPTQTQLPRPSSQAIDAGDDTVLNPPLNLTTDQRGGARLFGAHVDIGSVEVNNYSISISAGNGQIAQINTAFATQLKVIVKESGNAVSGIPVTFTAPSSGASGTFQTTGTNTATVNTDANGVATAPVFTANSPAGGPYNVVASLGTVSTSINFSLTNLTGNQTITFAALPDKTFGDAPFNVSATATSGLAVTFSSDTTSVCTVNGNTVTILAAGNCAVRASQAGDSNYNPAPDLARSFTVAKAGQTITFSTLSNRTFGDADFTVSATGGASGNPVTFAAGGQCSITGSTVHLTGAGSCTVTASQAGDSNFNAAADVQQSFQIAKAATSTALSSSPNPSIIGHSVTFTATVTSTAGTPTGTVTLKDNGNAISTCTSVVLTSGQATCTTNTLSLGSHTITADYSGDLNFSVSTGTLSGGQSVSEGLEFSQATFTVNERGGSVTITVNRSGDASQAASVDYATDDGSIPSVTVPCSAVTGLALERCDYTRVTGTLNFAPGQREKTFVILVNDDSYVEGTETTSLRLSNPVGAPLAPQSSATLQITDDAQRTTNPIDDPQFFVTQHYHDFLNREPDASGFSFWTNQMTNCGASDTTVCRVNVSAAFFLSIEFQQTGYLVEKMYKVSFGDATGNSTLGGAHQLSVPVVRLQEFLRDTQEVESTPTQVIVGQGNWQQQLENNKNAFALEFVGRARFAAAFPSSMTADAFVNQLNTNAGGVLTPSNISQFDSVFGGPSASSNDASKRAQVLRQVAENATLQQREFDRAFVLMQYFGYLRRNPNDAPDMDYTGYNFWLSKLDQFGGNFQSAEMVKALISSDEYRHRFGN